MDEARAERSYGELCILGTEGSNENLAHIAPPRIPSPAPQPPCAGLGGDHLSGCVVRKTAGLLRSC